MPVELSDIVSERRWIAVDVAGQGVQVAYTPNAITLRRSNELEQLMRRIDNDPDIDMGVEMARMFCDIVVDWDILQDGEPYPITVDALMDFPANILTIILGTVQKDMEADADEKKVSGATSGAGSSAGGSLGPVRNGTR